MTEYELVIDRDDLVYLKEELISLREEISEEYTPRINFILDVLDGYLEDLE